jgi:hypothetical protein
MKNRIVLWVMSAILCVFIAKGFFIAKELHDTLLQLVKEPAFEQCAKHIGKNIKDLKDFLMLCSVLVSAIIIPTFFVKPHCAHNKK